MSNGIRRMVYQLGRSHGWLKRHLVQQMYEEGLGHGMGEANPSPEIEALVSAAHADEFHRGFRNGVLAYEETL